MQSVAKPIYNPSRKMFANTPRNLPVKASNSEHANPRNKTTDGQYVRYIFYI